MKDSAFRLFHDLAESEGVVESPTDISIADARPLEMPEIVWRNYDNPPAKMIVTNTGHTVNVGGKWESSRSYLREGPFRGQYVFAQMHFHWGPDDQIGSEHSVDGHKMPMELHVVHINRIYKSQDAALREKDGVAIISYFFQIQKEDNPDLKPIIDALPMITLPQTSTSISPIGIGTFLVPFQKDYFMYCGSMSATVCQHVILWLISRTPLGISSEQLARFRQVRDVHGDFMVKNFRDTNPREKHTLFHINPSARIESTLFPAFAGHLPAGSVDDATRYPKQAEEGLEEGDKERKLSKDTERKLRSELEAKLSTGDEEDGKGGRIISSERRVRESLAQPSTERDPTEDFTEFEKGLIRAGLSPEEVLKSRADAELTKKAAEFKFTEAEKELLKAGLTPEDILKRRASADQAKKAIEADFTDAEKDLLRAGFTHEEILKRRTQAELKRIAGEDLTDEENEMRRAGISPEEILRRRAEAELNRKAAAAGFTEAEKDLLKAGLTTEEILKRRADSEFDRIAAEVGLTDAEKELLKAGLTPEEILKRRTDAELNKIAAEAGLTEEEKALLKAGLSPKEILKRRAEAELQRIAAEAGITNLTEVEKELLGAGLAPEEILKKRADAELIRRAADAGLTDLTEDEKDQLRAGVTPEEVLRRRAEKEIKRIAAENGFTEEETQWLREGVTPEEIRRRREDAELNKIAAEAGLTNLTEDERDMLRVGITPEEILAKRFEEEVDRIAEECGFTDDEKELLKAGATQEAILKRRAEAELNRKAAEAGLTEEEKDLLLAGQTVDEILKRRAETELNKIAAEAGLTDLTEEEKELLRTGTTPKEILERREDAELTRIAAGKGLTEEEKELLRTGASPEDILKRRTDKAVKRTAEGEGLTEEEKELLRTGEDILKRRNEAELKRIAAGEGLTEEEKELLRTGATPEDILKRRIDAELKRIAAGEGLTEEEKEMLKAGVTPEDILKRRAVAQQLAGKEPEAEDKKHADASGRETHLQISQDGRPLSTDLIGKHISKVTPSTAELRGSARSSASMSPDSSADQMRRAPTTTTTKDRAKDDSGGLTDLKETPGEAVPELARKESPLKADLSRRPTEGTLDKEISLEDISDESSKKLKKAQSGEVVRLSSKSSSCVGVYKTPSESEAARKSDSQQRRESAAEREERIEAQKTAEKRKKLPDSSSISGRKGLPPREGSIKSAKESEMRKEKVPSSQKFEGSGQLRSKTASYTSKLGSGTTLPASARGVERAGSKPASAGSTSTGLSTKQKKDMTRTSSTEEIKQKKERRADSGSLRDTENGGQGRRESQRSAGGQEGRRKESGRGQDEDGGRDGKEGYRRDSEDSGGGQERREGQEGGGAAGEEGRRRDSGGGQEGDDGRDGKDGRRRGPEAARDREIEDEEEEEAEEGEYDQKRAAPPKSGSRDETKSLAESSKTEKSRGAGSARERTSEAGPRKESLLSEQRSSVASLTVPDSRKQSSGLDQQRSSTSLTVPEGRRDDMDAKGVGSTVSVVPARDTESGRVSKGGSERRRSSEVPRDAEARRASAGRESPRSVGSQESRRSFPREGTPAGGSQRFAQDDDERRKSRSEREGSQIPGTPDSRRAFSREGEPTEGKMEGTRDDLHGLKDRVDFSASRDQIDLTGGYPLRILDRVDQRSPRRGGPGATPSAAGEILEETGISPQAPEAEEVVFTAREKELPAEPPPTEFQFFVPGEEEKEAQEFPEFFNCMAVLKAPLHRKTSLQVVKKTAPCHGKAMEKYKEEKSAWERNQKNRLAAEKEAAMFANMTEEERNALASKAARERRESKLQGGDDEVTGTGWPFQPIYQFRSFPSPINITLKNLPSLKVKPLIFDGHFTLQTRTKLTNTGDTVEVRILNPTLTPSLRGGPLLDDYIFDSMHFHWSNGPAPDALGGVHTVDGQRSCIEAHMIHYSAKYNNKKEAIQHDGGLCAVAFMFNNSQFQKLQQVNAITLSSLLSSHPPDNRPMFLASAT